LLNAAHLFLRETIHPRAHQFRAWRKKAARRAALPAAGKGCAD
jgi:hypothetical protein